MNDSTLNARAYLAAGLLVVFIASPLMAQRDDYSGPPINYKTARVNDPVARLSRKVETGKTELKFDDVYGYLKAVLKELDVPESSQTLVFSKTSMQRSRISKQTPRAIYFNDNVYVGFCQKGAVIEFATTDAKQGAIFYTLKQTPEAIPKFVRDRGQCTVCHSSSRTQSVPGYLIRSVYADASGQPEFGSGTFTTDHTSPLKERWGGWFVTGKHGDMRHMGNVTLDKRRGELNRETGANVTTLKDRVDTSPYLTPHSDIVALMVMEYQTQMHNAIAWANYETRRAVHQSEIMNKALDRPGGFISEISQRRINSAADQVLKYLLMCDEFALTSPVVGTSSFTADFQKRGVRDSKGRSLRDLDLKTRMFRYPCSYLIYSAAFDALPGEVRSRILKKLKAILQARDGDEAYAHLTPADRRNILDILNDTKPEFAAIQPEKE